MRGSLSTVLTASSCWPLGRYIAAAYSRRLEFCYRLHGVQQASGLRRSDSNFQSQADAPSSDSLKEIRLYTLSGLNAASRQEYAILTGFQLMGQDELRDQAKTSARLSSFHEEVMHQVLQLPVAVPWHVCFSSSWIGLRVWHSCRPVNVILSWHSCPTVEHLRPIFNAGHQRHCCQHRGSLACTLLHLRHRAANF